MRENKSKNKTTKTHLVQGDDEAAVEQQTDDDDPLEGVVLEHPVAQHAPPCETQETSREINKGRATPQQNPT